MDKEGIDNIEGVRGQFAARGSMSSIIFGSGTVDKVHALNYQIVAASAM
ncbi:MAG: hypothetical protein ACLR5N_05400 [Haemophilus parainfluenzae]